jgi:hypothetical protein
MSKNTEKSVDVKAESTCDHIRVYLDGVMHLSIKQNDLVGIKSYKIGKVDTYNIDFFMKDTTIDCNYTRKDIWENILKELQKLTCA